MNRPLRLELGPFSPKVGTPGHEMGRFSGRIHTKCCKTVTFIAKVCYFIDKNVMLQLPMSFYPSFARLQAVEQFAPNHGLQILRKQRASILFSV